MEAQQTAVRAPTTAGVSLDMAFDGSVFIERSITEAQETLILTVCAAFGIVFVCGGIQGYQVFVGDLRRAGRLEWPLRILFIAGGMVLAAPGGGILKTTNLEMNMLAAAILVPAVMLWLWASRRSRSSREAATPPA